MAEEEQEQPVFSPSKSAMDLTASQQLAESPRRPLPMSEVRHLGPVELIEFANELRNTPGIDLGAAERLASKSAPVIPKPAAPRRPRKKRGKGKDGEEPGLSAEQLKAQQQADMECARLNKVIEGLKAQMQKRQTELEETSKKIETLTVQLKKQAQEEHKAEVELKELEDENAELAKDLDRTNDRCVQDRINVNSIRAKIAEIEATIKEAEDAANNKHRSGLDDIKIKFGPTPDKDKPEKEEHEHEMTWFETIKLPAAIELQEKVKAELARKTGGRAGREGGLPGSPKRRGPGSKPKTAFA